MQNAISGELNAKFEAWKELRDEMGQIAEEYQAIVENECFLENEYYRLQMENLEKEFYKKQKEFYGLAGTLRAICTLPIYLN